MDAVTAKIIAALATDPDTLKKVLPIVCAVIIGVLGVLLLPVYVLMIILNTDGNPAAKNNAGLAAWVQDAYADQWEYEVGAYGEVNPERGVPTTDDSGLVIGYLCYDAAAGTFEEPDIQQIYSYVDTIDSMPEDEGIGVYDGKQIGIYVGDGEVIFASEAEMAVVMEDLEERDWLFWMLFEGIEYPETVTDLIGGSE